MVHGNLDCIFQSFCRLSHCHFKTCLGGSLRGLSYMSVRVTRRRLRSVLNFENIRKMGEGNESKTFLYCLMCQNNKDCQSVPNDTFQEDRPRPFYSQRKKYCLTNLHTKIYLYCVTLIGLSKWYCLLLLLKKL